MLPNGFPPPGGNTPVPSAPIPRPGAPGTSPPARPWRAGPGPPARPSAPGAPAPRPRPRAGHSGHGPISHTPDRSGFPSAVRGVGASRLILPSGVLGTFLSENFGHWARSDGESPSAAVTTAVATISLAKGFILACPC